MRRFEPGEPVALREIWRGRLWAARAATVVEDAEHQTTFFIPAGTRWMSPSYGGRWLRIPRDRFELAERRYDEAHVLSFAWPETPYAVLRFFRPDWRSWDWYVNLQDPPRRSAVGFDTMDQELDVIVELDGSWRWKDEDELAEAIRRGVIAPEDEPRLRADGERAVRRILDGEPPFDLDWSTWRPDPSWPPPELPTGWDEVPDTSPSSPYAGGTMPSSD